MVILYLAAGSTQHLYQDMRKYVVVGLMKPSWINKDDKILQNSIFIVLLGHMYRMSIRKETTATPPFQSSNKVLFILKDPLMMLN